MADFTGKPFTGRNDKYGSNSNDPVLSRLLTGIATQNNAVEMDRQFRYANNWRAFFSVGLNTEEAVRIGKEKGQTLARQNYVKLAILKKVAFTFGKSWDLSLDYAPLSYDQQTQTAEDSQIPDVVIQERAKLTEMVQFADDVFHKDNNGDAIRIEGGLFSKVTGDAFLIVSPILPDSLESTVNANTGLQVSLADAIINVRVVNSANCIPLYATDGVTLAQFTARYGVAIPSVIPGVNPVSGVFEQIITPTTVTETLFGANGEKYNSITKPNPIGMVFAVHVKNYPCPGVYGFDDVKDIIGLNTELNDKISNVSDIIDYHSAPTTIVFGARAQNLEKGANKVWSGFPTTARVENLMIQGDLVAANTFMTNIQQMIKETTGVNEAALGSDLAISNTSAVALSMRFYSMSSDALLSWSAWQTGVKQITTLILKWGVFLKQIQVPDGFWTKFRRALNVTFYSNLPKDELLEIQKNKEGVADGLLSRAKALSNLGSKDPQGDLAAIEQELKDYPTLTALMTAGAVVPGITDVKPPENSDNGGLDISKEQGTNGSTGRNVSGIRASTEANPKKS